MHNSSSELHSGMEFVMSIKCILYNNVLEGIENSERRLSQIIEESSNSESVNCNTSLSLVRREILNRNSENLNDKIMERGSAEFINR